MATTNDIFTSLHTDDEVLIVKVPFTKDGRKWLKEQRKYEDGDNTLKIITFMVSHSPPLSHFTLSSARSDRLHGLRGMERSGLGRDGTARRGPTNRQ